MSYSSFTHRGKYLVGAIHVAGALVLGNPAGAEVINKIVATVDGAPITMREVDEYGKRNSGGQALPERGVILDAVINDKLIEREATQKGIEIHDDDVDRYITTIKERNRIDDEKLGQALKAQGLTLEQYRAQVRKEIQRQQLINREIRGKVNVTPEEIDRYYKAHLDEYGAPPGYQVGQILIAVPKDPSNTDLGAAKAKADEVYKKLKGGEDFADAAKQYSDDAGSAADGGILGWFKKGELVDSLEKEVLKLDKGQISKPVRGPQGFHIMKLVDTRTETGDVASEQSDQIKEKLYAEALEKRFKEWLETDLRNRHHVELLP